MTLVRLFFFAASLTTGPAPPPAASAPPRASSPAPMSAASPPLSSESLAVLRTSFQDRKVLRRDTLALSWRMRKKRSLVEIDRDPRREARAVARFSYADLMSDAKLFSLRHDRIRPTISMT